MEEIKAQEVVVTVIFKNKETQEEETSELHLNKEDIACFYRDQYGSYVTMYSGKTYKVTQTLKELEAL